MVKPAVAAHMLRVARGQARIDKGDWYDMRAIGIAVLAALALSLTAGSAAAARHIETSGVRRISVLARALAFLPAGGGNIRCEVTYDITLDNESIAKTMGLRMGRVTISIRNCEGGIVRTLGTATWNVNFVSFTGVLPNITSITAEIVDVELLYDNLIVRCLYRGNARFIFRNNPITTARADETASLPYFERLGSGFVCPASLGRNGELPIIAPTRGVSLRLLN